MTTFQKLKHEARRAEQRSNWARAIDLYQRALEADEDMADLSLFNRIGDLHLRLGQTEEAVACYERAVDRYADNGMLTSAIALCNKILRIAPTRMSVYRRLGALHGRTGLVVEGRTNCLKYARHAIENGRLDDAVAAVDEFTDPTGDEDARLQLAGLLAERGEQGTAVAQLRAVLRARRSRGAETDDLRERIEQLAPDEAKIEPDGEEEAAGPEGAAPPEAETARSGPVRLAALVADRLDASGETAPFRAERAEADGRTEPPVDEGLAGVRRVLGAFREQMSDAFESADPTVRYDLGLEFMTIGLLDEAIEEFQAAVVDPSLVEAANARIGECLALRTSGSGFETIRGSARPSRRASEPAVPSAAAETAADGERAAASEAGARPPDEADAATPDEADAATPHETDAGADDDPSSAEPPVAAGESEDEDELQGHFFRARLAQYRIRRAEERHTVDHAAHLDLGTAYIGMELHQEALRELRVALEGPRPVANRAARALKRLALAERASPELALEVLERLAEQPSGATAETLGAELVEAWGGDHPLAERLGEIRGRLSEALEELPALEDMFPALEGSDRENTEVNGAETDGVAEPAPESGSPPDVTVSPVEKADELFAAGEIEEAKELLQATLEELDREKRTREGLRVLDRLLELEPDDTTLHERRVEMAVMSNDQQLVVRARAELGDCLRRRGEPVRARAAYGHILDVDPDNETARAAISAIDAEELEAERTAAGAESTAEATAPTEEEELAEVEALLDDLGVTDEEEVVVVGDEDESEADPMARSRYELGLAFRQMGMWEEAVRELRPALRGVADRLAVLEALGECLVKGGRSEEAVALLQENLRSDEDPEQVGPLYYLGLALAEEGSDAEAREILARVDAARPGYRDVQARLSELSL